MKTRSSILLALIIVFTCDIDAQIKLHNSGGISIGSDADPGEGIIRMDNATEFASQVTFINGTNLFEKYNSSDGLTILGNAGTLSMYPDGNYYRLNTSNETIAFEDKVQFNDGISVAAGEPANFSSTTTFNSAVNFGQYGTVNTTTFYGNVMFENANSSATFVSNRAAVFNTGLSASNYLTISGVLTLYGTFVNYSDINLKTKIKNIKNGSLGKIISLQGVTYNFKIDKTEVPPRSGFIAQDVQKIFPDLVVEGKEGLAIKSIELIPYLVEAIKEQENRINDLENQLKDLNMK